MHAEAADTTVGGKGLTEKMALHLMKEKLNLGHTVYMDNFYNSYKLASKLLAKKTYGTLHVDGKFIPQDLKLVTLKKGEAIARYGNGVMIAKCKNKRIVSYISTEFENEMVDFTIKWKVIKKKNTSNNKI